MSWQVWYDNLLPEDFERKTAETEILDIFLNYEEDITDAKREKEMAVSFSPKQQEQK